jgi:hypothetical protein
MAFKIGDKVVFIGGGINKDKMRCPKPNTEVVEVVGICLLYPDSYDLGGYEIEPISGREQSFTGKYLRLVEPQKEKKEYKSAIKDLVKEVLESEKLTQQEEVPEEIKIPVKR